MEVNSLPIMSNTRNDATASLVIGIVGLVVGLTLFCFARTCSLAVLVPCAVIGLIKGMSAKNRIIANGGIGEGKEIAKAGVILGWINLGLALLVIIVMVLTAFLLIKIGLFDYLQEWLKEIQKTLS